MENENCLSGIQCPKCGNSDRFLILATIVADVTDDGADIAANSDMDWNDRSHTRCPDCGKAGTLAAFMAPPATGETGSTSSKGLPIPFEAYEIHGVKEFVDGNNKYCEVVDDAEAEFWSLYGRIPGQGVDCIGDFKSRAFAEEIYARITGEHYGKR